MTTPEERLRAIGKARALLADLLDPKVTPRVPRSIRRRAAEVLKHHPTAFQFNEHYQERPDRAVRTPRP